MIARSRAGQGGRYAQYSRPAGLWQALVRRPHRPLRGRRHPLWCSRAKAPSRAGCSRGRRQRAREGLRRSATSPRHPVGARPRRQPCHGRDANARYSTAQVHGDLVECKRQMQEKRRAMMQTGPRRHRPAPRRAPAPPPRSLPPPAPPRSVESDEWDNQPTIPVRAMSRPRASPDRLTARGAYQRCEGSITSSISLSRRGAASSAVFPSGAGCAPSRPRGGIGVDADRRAGDAAVAHAGGPDGEASHRSRARP